MLAVATGVGRGVAVAVAVGVGVEVRVATGGGATTRATRARFARGRGVARGLGLALWRSGALNALSAVSGSTCWLTQYVAPPPTAMQPATAAAAAPGRTPASGVGSEIRLYKENA